MDNLSFKFTSDDVRGWNPRSYTAEGFFWSALIGAFNSPENRNSSNPLIKIGPFSETAATPEKYEVRMEINGVEVPCKEIIEGFVAHIREDIERITAHMCEERIVTVEERLQGEFNNVLASLDTMKEIARSATSNLAT